MNGVLAIEKIYEIDKFLSQNEDFLNYKIVLQLSARIETIVLLKEKKGTNWYYEQEVFSGCEKLVKISEIAFDDDEKDEYGIVFSTKIELGLRRRLTNLIVPNPMQVEKPCPVITFYSYKGGTGRTTTLTFFASWLASNFGKTVVILDCDFEAPGCTNYFEIASHKKGIVEYFLDKEYAKLKNIMLDIKKDYAHEVNHNYTTGADGKGKIFIIPAGNLSYDMIDEHSKRTFLNDYLEALARFDISSVHHIVKQFESFFADLGAALELDYQNSVILIDSRTGFNDTFSVLSILSDIIVGFFGINKQSQTGMRQFMDMFGMSDKPILLTKTFHNQGNESLNAFKDFVEEFVSSNTEKFLDVSDERSFGKSPFSNSVYEIESNSFLENWGTPLERHNQGTINGSEKLVNVDIIKKLIPRPPIVFENLFNAVKLQLDNNILGKNNLSEKNQTASEPDRSLANLSSSAKIDDVFFENIKHKINRLFSREKILRDLSDENNFPQPYADTSSSPPSLSSFFFRDAMKDIFIRERFLIVGYKGTGKTLIYRAFENEEITNALCRREKQNKEKFIFLNVVPVSDYFAVHVNFSASEINSQASDFFYTNFWLVYSWSILFRSDKIRALSVESLLPVFEINKDNATRFLELINDRARMDLIRQSLKLLDKKLTELKKNLILSYDKLDFVVKPINWDKGISPLINYWRTNPFSNIFPKIFVRSDIFENKLGNITNFNEVSIENAISLQWTKQELFAYFFKYVFKICKNDFIALAYAYQDYTSWAKEQLLKIYNELDDDEQINVQKDEQLQFLVTCFFGKNAFKYGEETYTNYGTSYDWFYNNLKDAKDSFSIRPFLDLLKKSMQIALENDNLKFEKENVYRSKQILAAFFYSNNIARAYAAKQYYEDLAKEEGNEPLLLFYQYLSSHSPDRLRLYEFKREHLDELLNGLLKYFSNYPHINEIDSVGLRDLLLRNGVLQESHVTNKNLTRYTIPFLYRNYFSVGKKI